MYKKKVVALVLSVAALACSAGGTQKLSNEDRDKRITSGLKGEELHKAIVNELKGVDGGAGVSGVTNVTEDASCPDPNYEITKVAARNIPSEVLEGIPSLFRPTSPGAYAFKISGIVDVTKVSEILGWITADCTEWLPLQEGSGAGVIASNSIVRFIRKKFRVENDTLEMWITGFKYRDRNEFTELIEGDSVPAYGALVHYCSGRRSVNLQPFSAD